MSSNDTVGYSAEYYWELPLTLYRIATVLVLVLGVLINYKLFDNTRKERPGEKGKVFQQIMKNYATIQAISWPVIGFALIGMMMVLHTYGADIEYIVSPCIYVYILHIMVFYFILLRFYVALNSFILAFGRYAFVVHDDRVFYLEWRKWEKY